MRLMVPLSYYIITIIHLLFLPSLSKKIMNTYQLIATILLTMNCLRSRGFIASSVKKLYTAHVNGGRISTISRPVKQQSKSLLSQMHRWMNNESNSKHKWANMLYRYDKGNFGLANCVKCDFIQPLSLDEALTHATVLKLSLGEEAEHSFAVLPDSKKLLSILEAMQHPSVAEQAAHLFYYIIKDHPFIDGNKRIAVDLCVHFVHKNGLTPINKNMDQFRKSLMFHAIYVAVSKDKDPFFSFLLDFLATELEVANVNNNNK